MDLPVNRRASRHSGCSTRTGKAGAAAKSMTSEGRLTRSICGAFGDRVALAGEERVHRRTSDRLDAVWGLGWARGRRLLFCLQATVGQAKGRETEQRQGGKKRKGAFFL